MRLLERNPRLSGVMFGFAVLALASVQAQAQLEISSTRPGTIVIYPKVIADGTRDTILSLTNTTNGMVYVHCEATNGIGTCERSPDPANQVYYCNHDNDCRSRTDPSGATVTDIGPCQVNWQPGDFELALTAQQPTFWRVSTGRMQDPDLASGTACTQNGKICPGFFMSPADNQGAGASVPGFQGFRGEVRCFQVSQTGEILRANALKGEAFIEQISPTPSTAGRLSAYNSINVEGTTPVAGPAGAGNEAILDGVNFARCPESLTIDHLAPGPGGDGVEVELTFVPCSFNTGSSIDMAINLESYDEMESPASGGDARRCWANYTGSLDSSTQNRATTFLRTLAQATQDGNCTAGSAVGLDCGSHADCGGNSVGEGGFCFQNVCQSGTAAGRRCNPNVPTHCGFDVSANCGPPSNILGVVETFYTDNTIPGSAADVAYQFSPGTGTDTMSFTDIPANP